MNGGGAQNPIGFAGLVETLGHIFNLFPLYLLFIIPEFTV
jgi:hypothetical protein